MGAVNSVDSGAEARERLEDIKRKYQYKEGCFHIAVVGNTSAGKSSLINALRGILDNEEGAAETGDGETTQVYKRYVDPRTSKLVWYDIPGSGTQDHPSWEYFSKESLFLFDAILIMIEATIMEMDIDLIKKANSQSPPIQSHIIRAKSDTHILSNLQDAAHYDASDLDAVQAAKDVVSTNARAAVELQVQKAGLPADTRFYQVNKHTLLALVKGDKRRLAAFKKFQIDEERLIEDLLGDVRERAEQSQYLLGDVRERAGRSQYLLEDVRERAGQSQYLLGDVRERAGRSQYLLEDVRERAGQS